MTTGTAAMATSLDGFHPTATRSVDELARAFFAASTTMTMSASDPPRRARSFL